MRWRRVFALSTLIPLSAFATSSSAEGRPIYGSLPGNDGWNRVRATPDEDASLSTVTAAEWELVMRGKGAVLQKACVSFGGAACADRDVGVLVYTAHFDQLLHFVVVEVLHDVQGVNPDVA